MRIFDRYVLREVALPFLLSLLLLTFLLIIPPVLKQAYPLIAKGVDVRVVALVLVFLLPQLVPQSLFKLPQGCFRTGHPELRFLHQTQGRVEQFPARLNQARLPGLCHGVGHG